MVHLKKLGGFAVVLASISALAACSGTSVGSGEGLPSSANGAKGGGDTTSTNGGSTTTPDPSASNPPSARPSGGTSGDNGGSTEPTGLDKSTFTVSVDGQKGTPTRVIVTSDVVSGVTRHMVDLYFTAPGMGTETRLNVSAATVGNGCTVTTDTQTGLNWLALQPDDGTYRTMWSGPRSGACGLAVTELDDHLVGWFRGTVTDDGAGGPTTASVVTDFDISLR